jgi:hypothetical protein
MSELTDAHTRFANLLEQYDLPRDAFSLETEDSENWLFVRKDDFLGDSDFAIWMQLVDAYGEDISQDLPFQAFQIDELPEAPAEQHTEQRTEPERPPASTVSTDALESARRMLTNLQDIQIEEEGEVSPWILAARRAVTLQLDQRHDD